MVRSLGELLSAAAVAWPESEIVFPDSRATLRELDERATERAKLIRAAGAERGDKVGYLLSPGMPLVEVLFGIARAGCVAVPISDRLKVREIAHIVRHADVRVLVTSDEPGARLDFPAMIAEATGVEEGAPGLHPAPREAPELARIVVLAGQGRERLGSTPERHLAELVSGVDSDSIAALQAAVLSDDLAYIMYTSGTSAAPKGCMIPHDNVIQQGRALADDRYGLDSGCSFWCPLPLFHNGGLATLTACLSSGATFVHAGHFDPGVSLRQLEDEGCTHAIPTFETIWLPILDHPHFPQADLSRLRMILNAGSEERLRQFQARLPHVAQLANYGSTECTGHFSMTLPTDPLEIALTTGGHPLTGMEARVVDPETGRDLPRGARGEILVRGRMRFLGYYKDPEATAAAIDAEGWFHTGDLGRLDAEGRVTFSGRLKDMLKVGGENVAAMEVEAHLLQHPAVNIAAVVGAPDAVYSEVPAAYIELKPGVSATEQEIVDHCLGSIATFKVPRYVRFVTEWPMSGTKIQKFVLKERIGAELRERGITAAPKMLSPTATPTATAGRGEAMKPA